MDRRDALIDRLLGEAEQAVVSEDWAVVRARARSILALSPDHPEGSALLAAAGRAAPSSPGPSTSDGTSAARPDEGVGGRDASADQWAPPGPDHLEQASADTTVPESRPADTATSKSGGLVDGCFLLAIVAAVLFGVGASLVALVSPGGSSSLSRGELCVLARNAVSAELLSPSTAEFPDSFCTAVSFNEQRSASGEKIWRVAGPVDAQNGFGAMIRHHYVVEIVDKGLGWSSPTRVISITPVR